MIFTLYGGIDEAGAPRPDTISAIPEAAAKWALVAPPIWLAWHRLWFALAVYLLIGALVLAMLFTPYWPAALVLGGIPAIYLFLEGHQLRRRALDRAGAVMLGVVDASSAEIAVARFLDEHGMAEREPTTPSRPVPAAARRDDSPTFGLFADNGA